MKQIVLLITLFSAVSLSSPLGAQNPNANWRALVSKAYSQSDVVMSGEVLSIDDQTARDGGHVYSLRVTGRHKGGPQEQISVRAGGFFYTVPLEVDESVLLFLKSTRSGKSSVRGPDYSMVEVATLRPMAFRLSGPDAKPVDRRLQAEFAQVSAQEIEDFLSSIRP